MTAVAPNLCQRVCKLTLPAASEAGTYAYLFTGSGNAQGARLPAEMFSGGAHAAQADGGDVCFASSAAGTSRLNMEVVGPIGATTCAIWVSVTLSAVETTDVYVFYQSNSGTLTQPAASASYGSQAVWATVGHEAVWHFNEIGINPTLVDSTSHAHNSISQTWTPGVSGEVGSAGSLNGSGDGFSLAPITTGASFTFSGWLQPNGQTGNYGSIFTQGAGLGLLYRGSAAGGEAGKLTWFYSALNHYCTTPLTDGSWNYVAVAVNGTAVDFYLNGSPNGTVEGGTTINANAMGRDSANEYFKGLFDEFRLAPSVRSASYIATDYAIQSSASLVTVGTPTIFSTASSMKLSNLFLCRIKG
jgi:hypothetical protein